MEEVQILDIGARLKARRLELGCSLMDAAECTRIRKVYLESLEANQFEVLPGKVYVSGFIKVYAAYLGLDAAPLLDDLPGTKTDSHLSENRVGTINEGFSSGGWGAFFVVLVAVLLFGAAIFFMPGMF